MPFGAQIAATGGVGFRLWAPSINAVDLCLVESGGKQQYLQMEPLPDGWFYLFVPHVGVGACYRFRIEHDLLVPDPASRYQPEDVHGPSQVVDPLGFLWTDSDWDGRPWEEAVIYELHVGAFSDKGTFAGVAERLDYLVDLGITAIELMPVADFPGQRNWGYDGALLFAPDSAYGRPEELKKLVQTAHAKGLMVFLDVVYNHFGPEGNYLHAYAKEAFFTEKYPTPWGAAVNFSGEHSRTVRDFFIHNVLYWLEEYHFDGLRLDAVHAIFDDSSPDILEEIAQAVRAGPGRERRIHLILENDSNAARYLERKKTGTPRYYTAQWNDDIHHACHVLLTGERSGHYIDYAEEPLHHLGRCLTEGFAYQGEASSYRQGSPRGEPSSHLPLTAFISFLQNHDQVGNRALGKRLPALIKEEQLIRIATALFLLSPAPPLLFMGEELGARTPFLFFCDFGPDLAGKVTAGRRREFARFPEFSKQDIPDPNAPETFQGSCLDWVEVASDTGKRFYELYKKLLLLRQEKIVPRLGGIEGKKARYQLIEPKGLHVHWRLGDSSQLQVIANFAAVPVPDFPLARDSLFYADSGPDQAIWREETLPPYSIFWFLEE